MSHPDDELLADVALGIAEPAPGVREHLERCDECASTVAELGRTAALVARGATAIRAPGDWESPPPRVWKHIDAAIADHNTLTPDHGTTLSTGREGTAAPTTRTPEVTRGDFAAPRRRQAWPWAAGLAAAGIAIGLLAGRALWNESAPSSTTIAQAELDTLDTKQPLGEVTVVRTSTGIDLQVATKTALDPGDGYLEVWLINNDGKRMVSVGLLDTGSGTFPISESLLKHGYIVVDISRESYDDRPEHSGDSLVRGTLPA